MVGLLGLAAYGLMLAGCLLAHLAPQGSLLRPWALTGCGSTLAYTFGLVWPVGTVVTLVERIDRRVRARGGTGCGGMVSWGQAGVA